MVSKSKLVSDLDSCKELVWAFNNLLMGSNTQNLNRIYQSPKDQSMLEHKCVGFFLICLTLILQQSSYLSVKLWARMSTTYGTDCPAWGIHSLLVEQVSGDRSHLSIAQTSQVWSDSLCWPKVNSAPPPPAELDHCVFIQPIYIFKLPSCVYKAVLL